MGYRLNVRSVTTKPDFYGTKLFGYQDNNKLKSFKYLVDKFKLDSDACFEYCCNNYCLLTAEEFSEFVELYNSDMNDYYLSNDAPYTAEKDCFINNEEIKELLKNDDDKLIFWD